MEKICIIGGGASALMCACFARGSAEVTIIECADKIGKKILATGNGRCNLLNANMNDCSYNVSVQEFTNHFKVGEIIKFFNNIGLEVYKDDEGRFYPISNTATSVLDVFKNYLCLKENVKIRTETGAISIKSQKNGYIVNFEGGDGEYFDKVVVATGNYTNFDMIKNFNIKFKPFCPSLCSLKTEKHKNLSGVRVDNVKIVCKSKSIDFSEIGEVLFKDEGLSGIVIFNLSAHMARANDYSHSIFIDLMPNMKYIDVVNILLRRRENLKNQKVEEFLTGLFHKQVNLEILKRCNVNMNKYSYMLTNDELDNIAETIKSLKFNSCGYYENNQVMSGGVYLSELTNMLESKLYKGLYFIGEVVDVDGVCGGFNLGWAWVSGKIVGERI